MNIGVAAALAKALGGGGSSPSGGGGGLVVTFDTDHFVLDKTWQEIYDAASAGRSVVMVATGFGVMYLVDCEEPQAPGDSYYVAFAYANANVVGELSCAKYTCAEATDYPAASIG